MWIYLLIFAIPLTAYLFDKGTNNRSPIFLVCYTLFLALFVGFGDMLGGYDRYIYGEIFDSIYNDLTVEIPVSESYAMGYYEVGYSYINWAIAHITGNRYMFILIYSVLIYINFYIAFKRHASNYPFAFMVFMGLMFFFTFTYLRQVYGVSLSLLSIKYLLKRQWWMFFLIVSLVALIHKSGIVFALVFFIPERKYSRWTVVTILALCLVLGMSGISSSFYDTYIEYADIKAQGDYKSEGAARIAYLMEVVVFSSIILYNYYRIGEKREEIVFLNMAFMFCVILLLFIRSENGGRLSWYFMFGIIFTMTNIISNSNHKTSGMFSTALIVLFFGLFVRILIEWGVLLYPYKTFLTSGHREGDPTFEIYEYDETYDIDKLKNLWAWK